MNVHAALARLNTFWSHAARLVRAKVSKTAPRGRGPVDISSVHRLNAQNDHCQICSLKTLRTGAQRYDHSTFYRQPLERIAAINHWKESVKKLFRHHQARHTNKRFHETHNATITKTFFDMVVCCWRFITTMVLQHHNWVCTISSFISLVFCVCSLQLFRTPCAR